MRYLLFTICFGAIFLFTATSFAQKFPYRDTYPEVNVLELSEVKSGYDRGELVLVDIRSKTEFETIRIKNAINIPYADARFTGQLGDVVIEHLGKKIVVYGNGITCIKSYKAAEDAKMDSLPEVYAYDGGIMAWAVAYPADTLLLEDELRDPREQLISEDAFIPHTLGYEEFKRKALEANSVVIDARDPIQRTREVEGLEKAMEVPLDKLVKNIINREHLKDKQLLIFDQVGGQVNWLMYYLVDKGYTNFYFLSGGATSVLEKQEYRLSYVQ